MINFLKKHWILIVIFIIFAFLRFQDLDKRIIFDWDQEQFSYQIKKIVEHGDFTLLGPRANNDRGFFLGPYFTYLLTPFYLFRNLHPKALLDFIVVYNISFFLFSYFALKKLFSHNVAIIFLSLWSINSGIVAYDIIPWWPVILPIGIMGIIYILKNIYDKPTHKKYLILGLLLGIFSNIHFQFLFLILFSIIFLLLRKKKNELFKIKNISYFVFSFLFTFFPLLIFDLRNNFLNSKLFLAFFLEDNPGLVNDKNIWTVVFANFLKPFIFVENKDYMWLFLFVIAGLLIYLIKKTKSFSKNFFISFLAILIVTPIIFYFYGTRPSEYYFIYLLPFILITLAQFIITFKRKYLLIPLILFILAVNNMSLKKNLKSIPIGLYYKDKAVKTLKDNINLNNKYNVTIDAPLGFHNGYKYLLDWYQIPQSGNFEDALIQIKLPPEKVNIRVNDGIGLIIPKSLRK